MTTRTADDDAAPRNAFAAAFTGHDRDAVESLLTDDVMLRSPIISTPFEGKREVMHVLGVVRDCFDQHSLKENCLASPLSDIIHQSENP